MGLIIFARLYPQSGFHFTNLIHGYKVNFVESWAIDAEEIGFAFA